MSKQAKKGEKSVPVKKGALINRRNNRTINQDVAASNGKWEDIGGGVLKRRGPGSKTAYITLKDGKWTSITRKVAEVMSAPKEAPEEEQKKAA